MPKRPGQLAFCGSRRIERNALRAENRRLAREKIFRAMPLQVKAIREARERETAELALFLASLEPDAKL
jgi:hypothetical protein